MRKAIILAIDFSIVWNCMYWPIVFFTHAACRVQADIAFPLVRVRHTGKPFLHSNKCKLLNGLCDVATVAYVLGHVVDFHGADDAPDTFCFEHCAGQLPLRQRLLLEEILR